MATAAIGLHWTSLLLLLIVGKSLFFLIGSTKVLEFSGVVWVMCSFKLSRGWSVLIVHIWTLGGAGGKKGFGPNLITWTESRELMFSERRQYGFWVHMNNKCPPFFYKKQDRSITAEKCEYQGELDTWAAELGFLVTKSKISLLALPRSHLALLGKNKEL